eukprot:TRINITY_DN31995_c0_g1_i1.p1 TRINITY_DN31995_c0_g1~~TRINITY_DN31995_c0_g1_i1.p1  ORF type:complete len:450 (-),score=34.97 TRINITY_DN31995_c0_g1_i1:90-1439(-)
MTCPLSHFQKPNTFCAHEICEYHKDFDRCCFDALPCINIGSTDCPRGSWFNFGSYCLSDECIESRDRMVCCNPSEPCSPDAVAGTAGIVCPHGFVDKLDKRDIYCTFKECNMTIDRDRCCDEAAHCRTLQCPLSYTPDPIRNDTYCPAIACNLARDRDLCCTLAGVCATEYTCPHGYVADPGTYCDGIECIVDRDLDHCCDNAMPCNVLTCPKNFVLRPDVYCKGTSCIVLRDLYHCCERGMALKHYRWNVTDLRLANFKVVQASEITLWFHWYKIDFSQARCFSINGNNPVNGKENPDNACDRNFYTKWLDYSRTPIRIDLPTELPITSFSFTTADDSEHRDPFTWRLEGSPDNKVWIVLNENTDRNYGLAVVPLERKTETPKFYIGIPCFAPLQMHVDNSENITCAEGDILRNGSNCTTLCKDGYTPSPTQLSCVMGELAPKAFKCL